MIGIAVKPGKKIGVGIIPQNAVAFPRKAFIVYPAVPVQLLMGLSGKMVLIRDAIGRVGQDQRHKAIRDMRHQLHTVRAVNLVAQVKKLCFPSVLHALKPLQTWSSSACKAPYCVGTY